MEQFEERITKSAICRELVEQALGADLVDRIKFDPSYDTIWEKVNSKTSSEEKEALIAEIRKIYGSRG